MIINRFPLPSSAYDPVLANNTPYKIRDAVRAGVASTLWSVGDRTAEIEISSFGSGFSGANVCAFILGFDHNSTIEGTGIQFQIGKTTTGKDIALVDSKYGSSRSSGVYFNMKNSGGDSGGWKSSNMRNDVCSAFISSLPTDWQNCIVSTTKYTNNTGNGSTKQSDMTTTSDYIFLLSEYEVFGTTSGTTSYEYMYTAQYSFYQNGNSKVKYKHNSTSTACVWWLRSPYRLQTPSTFCTVTANGTASFGSNGSKYSWGFAPGFRIA